MNSSVFLTGATGFIGANLVKRLCSEGFEVNVLLREKSFHPLLNGLDFRSIYGDITDFDSLRRAMKGINFVYHLAALISFNPKDYEGLYKINVLGTKNIVKVSLELGIKKIVFTSACAVFGSSASHDLILDEDSLPDLNNYADNCYAYTKRLAEEEILNGCSKGLNSVIVNPSTVYGQGDMKLNSGFLVKKIFQNQIRFTPPGGTSCVSVDDVVEGHLLAMQYGKSAERYILSSLNISYFDLFNLIAEVVEAKRIKWKFPTFLYMPVAISAKLISVFSKDSWLLTPSIVKETFRFKYFSSQKAQRDLNWQPKVDLRAAINKAFEFYKSYNLI